MIDDATYQDYRAKLDQHKAWVNSIMRAAVEVYELHRDKPQRCTLYCGSAPRDAGEALYLGSITTWTGEHVGDYAVTAAWRDRYGNRRYSIRATLPGIGTYVGQTQGAGMYVNLRRVRS